MADCVNTPRRLLIIDDDASCRTTMACLLRKLGHAVEAVETGSSGLALLRQTPVDLVVTDLTMPGLTGWDVARLAKAMYPQLPVVLVTGCAHTIPLDQPERRLVDAILAKPCGMAEVQTVIGPLIRDVTETVRSGGPESVGLTGRMARPASASVTSGLDAPSHRWHMTGSAASDASIDGDRPARPQPCL